MRNVFPGELNAWQVFFRERSEVVAVYLFGSHGTEFEHPDSDIDLGIVFSHPVSLSDELDIDAALSMVLHSDRIDLINLNRAPIALQFRVLSEGLLVCERDYLLHSDFIERVIKQYWDYRFTYLRFSEDYNRALREGYEHG